MDIVQLNTINLDGNKVFIKKGGGGGGGNINNQEKSIDITENGVFEILPDRGFTGLSKVTANVEISAPIPARPIYTGHADVEGLRAIGWTDEDIAYYQEHGVNWNEEDDEYHKVSDDNKALYGVLTANNISNYKDRIVYLPKIDTSNVTDMSSMFNGCYSLTHLNLKNAKLEYQLDKSALLSKSSILYLINNEATTNAITIKLATYAYDRWANDADVLAALANHPNISLAK